MLKSLTDFFQQYTGSTAGDALRNEHTLELCAAVLMLEIALADSGLDQDELAVIQEAIRHHFHINEQEAQILISMARRQVDDATSLHEFTRIVNESLSREEKTIVIELLWKVAAADQVIDKYEEYFIRKIADLLYVSHKDYIRAKHRAAGDEE
jgi:uncharacterized tellurite resistance protein B-like protein